MRSPTPGPELFCNIQVNDRDGKPVADAEVDVWQSSTEGLYENQDPTQADMNLRGKFTTDKNGHFSFRSIKPAGYPIPITGPVGDLIRAQGRHNMRPAHLHFLIYKPGYKTHISQVYLPDDPNIETDVQFGVTRRLGELRPPREREAAGAGRERSVVLARLHVCHGAWHGQAAAPADPGQGHQHRNAAAGSRAGASFARAGEAKAGALREDLPHANCIANSRNDSRGTRTKRDVLRNRTRVPA